MNISIVDSASVALPYGRLVREFLAERARSRHELTGPNFFGDFPSVENPSLKLRALAEHPRALFPPKYTATKAEQLKLKKEDAAAAKAAAASALRSHRREKQPFRNERAKDRKHPARSRSRSRPRRRRSQRRASPKKKTMEKR